MPRVPAKRQSAVISRVVTVPYEFMSTFAVLMVMLLQLPPVPNWDTLARVLIPACIGLLTISGGLFLFAWSVAKKARAEWKGLADEWAKSHDFTIAVNTARQPFTDKLILETHNEVDRRVAAHNSDREAHSAAVKHAARGTEAAIGVHMASMRAELQRQVDENRRMVDDLRQRLDRLEDWDGNDRRGGRGRKV